MKKIILLLFPIFAFAQSFMLSNIPLPKTYVQNLDPYECNENCMRDYLNNGKIFSFLAHSNKILENEEQNEAKSMFVSILNLGSFSTGKKLKIALLLPYKKIGKYASSTTNATFAYLITKNHPFMLRSYKVATENISDLQTALHKIQEDGFVYVIAPLTQKGAVNVISLNPDTYVYFPTINKKDINTSSQYLSFGAIDYEKQSDLLLKEAVSPLVIFSDKSSTGYKLAQYQKSSFLAPPSQESDTTSALNNTFNLFDSIEITDEEYNKANEVQNKVVERFISRRTTNLESYLKDKDNIKQGSFFINTPIVKSGMVMSQLTLYDVNATNVLSTQINYDPLLLSMTQYIDRKEMIIANSITKNNNILIETNSLVGNDIVYDWINYTTTIGVDYFYSLATGDTRTYPIEMVDNQMVYEVELLKAGISKFRPYIPSSKNIQ